MSYQKITIVGHLGREPEMRYTPAGQAVTTLSVATNRRYTNGQGEQVQETAWFNVTAWGRQAENANQYLKRGNRVLVEGRLNPDPDTGGPCIWSRKDGGAGASYEVTANQIVFLGGGNEDAGAAPGEPEFVATEPAPQGGQIDHNVPF